MRSDTNSPAGKKRLRADLVLFGAVLVLAALLFFFLRMKKNDGAYAVVYVDGQRSASYLLTEETQVTLAGADGGSNVLVIRNGGAFLSSADCPDKVCVRTGTITKTGQSIICLPHRIVITIEGAGEADVDAVVQ